MTKQQTINSSLEDIIKVFPTFRLLNEITDQLKTDGFYCLENSLDLNVLSIFQEEIQALINTKGQRYFSLINPHKNIESNFNLFDKSYNLKKYLFELAKLGINKDISNTEILNILRVVTGKNAESQSLNFHYDATVITALVPILIPSGPIEQCGHLLAFKNLRRIRNNSIVNIIEKLIIQNSISRKIFSYFAMRKIENHLCELKEGNIYFFYGYRTLHANLPVNPDYQRATLLFHFGNPHEDSSLIKSATKLRHWREKNNSK